jgi:hypothetical protein
LEEEEEMLPYVIHDILNDEWLISFDKIADRILEIFFASLKKD